MELSCEGFSGEKKTIPKVVRSKPIFDILEEEPEGQ